MRRRRERAPRPTPSKHGSRPESAPPLRTRTARRSIVADVLDGDVADVLEVRGDELEDFTAGAIADAHALCAAARTDALGVGDGHHAPPARQVLGQGRAPVATARGLRRLGGLGTAPPSGAAGGVAPASGAGVVAASVALAGTSCPRAASKLDNCSVLTFWLLRPYSSRRAFCSRTVRELLVSRSLARVAAPRPAFLCLSAGSVRCSHDGEAKSRQRGRGSSQRDRDGLAACGAPGLHRPERSDRARHG